MAFLSRPSLPRAPLSVSQAPDSPRGFDLDLTSAHLGLSWRRKTPGREKPRRFLNAAEHICYRETDIYLFKRATIRVSLI